MNRCHVDRSVPLKTLLDRGDGATSNSSRLPEQDHLALAKPGKRVVCRRRMRGKASDLLVDQPECSALLWQDDGLPNSLPREEQFLQDSNVY